jgi:hypothetical protein
MLGQRIAIYLLRTENPDAIVEVEPDVQVGTHHKKPDIRTRQATEPWVNVEVTNPNTSDAQADVQRGLERLTELVHHCSGSFALEVFLKREPTSAELDLIEGEICNGQQPAGHSVVELPSGLGTLYWNQQPPGMVVMDDHGEQYTPRLSRASVVGGARESTAISPYAGLLRIRERRGSSSARAPNCQLMRQV